MIKRLLIGLLLFAFSFSLAAAQDYPEPVQKALAEFNQRLGLNLTLSDFNWRWSQELYDDSSLGCPMSGQTYRPGRVIGYKVEFVYEGITWDYRLSGDLETLFLCSPLATATPTPQPTYPRPTQRPTQTPALNASATPSICPPGPLPRLVNGQQGRVTSGIPNNVRDVPGMSGQFVGELPSNRMFYVLEGPVCAGGMAWWYVADTLSPVVGWTAEGQNGDYWLEPIYPAGYPTITPTPGGLAFPTNQPPLEIQPPTLTPWATGTLPMPTPGQLLPPSPTATQRPLPTTTATVCNSQLPPRLVIGETGRVTPGIPNNLRQGPGSSTAYVGEIPVGGVFTVLDGPRCASGMAWWQVSYNGLTGWTPEGQGSEYWVEPLAG